MKNETDDRVQFEENRKLNIQNLAKNDALHKLTSDWFLEANLSNYSYNFSWLGLPIIQYPQDIVALQEIIWTTKPDIVIETGVARGGSLVFSASMLRMLGRPGRVIGIDIDIRPHNRKAIEGHMLSSDITLLEGSSVSADIIKKVSALVPKDKKTMVILDSNHTHEHVLNELRLYSQFVSTGCYFIVMDTVIENLPKGYFKDRPWDKGNNAMTAVFEFLKENKSFEIDSSIHNKLMITVAPNGYLKRNI